MDTGQKKARRKEPLSPTEVTCVVALYRRFFDTLSQFLAHISRNAADAPDLVQEVFIKLIYDIRAGDAVVLLEGILFPRAPDCGRRRGRAKPVILTGARLRAWLFQTALNKMIDQARATSRREAREIMFYSREHALAPATQINTLGRHDVRERVWTVLDRLPRLYADLLYLWANDFSYYEMAAALDMNRQSIGQTLTRARAAFSSLYVSLFGAVSTGSAVRHTVRSR